MAEFELGGGAGGGWPDPELGGGVGGGWNDLELERDRDSLVLELRLLEGLDKSLSPLAAAATFWVNRWSVISASCAVKFVHNGFGLGVPSG